MEWNWCVRFYIMLSPCSADKPNLGKAIKREKDVSELVKTEE